MRIDARQPCNSLKIFGVAGNKNETIYQSGSGNQGIFLYVFRNAMVVLAIASST